MGERRRTRTYGMQRTGSVLPIRLGRNNVCTIMETVLLPNEP